MKKLLSSIFLMIFIAMSFSSCLGDDDVKINASNVFGVVNSINGEKFLATQNMIRFDGLDKYSVGDALFLSSYSGKYDNSTSNGIMNAEVVISKSYLNSQQKPILVEAADTATNIKEQIGIRSLRVISSSDIETVLLNRSLMDYTLFKKAGETFDLQFIYDKDKQVGKMGNPLGSDKAVVDVILIKRGTSVGTEEKSETTQFVLNSTALRDELMPSSYTSTITKSIDFRYSMYDTTTKKYSVGYSTSLLKFVYYPPR